MKIKIQQFLGKNHSWSVVGQNLAKVLSKNHLVHLQSTNGYDHFPEDLKSLVKAPDSSYDCQISYTMMKNFGKYLAHGKKNRLGIWNYEFTVLPKEMIKYYVLADWILPSSEFSKEIFLKAKVPESKLKVIHHGTDFTSFEKLRPMEFKSSSFKILANIAQPHIRKNLPGLLEAFGRAFDRKSHVSLILKVVDKKPEGLHEVSFSAIFKDFKRKFPNHAEIIVLDRFLPSLIPLYQAVDAVFTMTHAECFYLPGLEGLAAKKIVIAPRYGGQLDFLNDRNSLLIEGKKIRAPLEAQYHSGSIYSEMFEPSISDAVEKLRFAVSHPDLQEKFSSGYDELKTKFSWENVSDQMMSLCER